MNGIPPSPTLEGTRGTWDAKVMAEMRATMDELWHHNRTLKDDVQNIMQHQQVVIFSEEVELLDP